MKLAVIGTGYVGLVAGAGFADFGNDVTCADIDASRVAMLGRGELPLHEPGLGELLRQNVAAGRLGFTTDVGAAVRDAEVVLICVGTPPGRDGQADLTQVLEAARAVAENLGDGPTVVILKSTVPVGTSERVFAALSKHAPLPAPPGSAIAVVSNPEFLKEGSAVEDFMRPMRVIVGIGQAAWRHAGDGGEAIEPLRQHVVSLMRRLYHPVVRTNDRLLFCDARSAELCKYASNAYLAMRVSYINDIANLCERVGADVEMVRRGMGMDTRIGANFLFPGMGYGGSCFPKDVKALLAIARHGGLELPIVAATESVNERQRALLFQKLLRHHDIAESAQALAGKTFAIWGLSFKPETDDVREAPALFLIERLLAAGATVRASDPVANSNAAQALASLPGADRVTFFGDAYEAARAADALFLCTEWRQFRQPNFRRLKQLLRAPLLLDGRNIWDREQLRELGFHYYGIGR